MKLRYLTYFFFVISISTCFSQQRIKNVHVVVEYYAENEKSFRFFEASEDLFQVGVLSGEMNNFDISVNFRMEDELSSEAGYTVFSEVAYFDLQLNHKLGPFNISWSIENLLNSNSPSFAIEGSLERASPVIETVTFAHEADFLISSAISYRF
ncbi:hypothetical protein [Gramella sp. KN1008]|uniref:hypothetical protein n=1 Tax=Gramella sp. KN1008 TaxID=2529298 RepID=UPI0010399D59|nr:hypothetical protein [Gramella sp. KN1008]TBW30240.1 hypothetical protein EZJ28_02225 [Gramella sp. KN1008]